MADTPKVRFESWMLIEGKLVGGEAGTFTNIYEEVAQVLRENSGVMAVVHPVADYQAAEPGLHDLRVLLWAH